MSGEGYEELTVTEEIDGIAYTSTKFPTMQSLKLMFRTVKVLGENGLKIVVRQSLKRFDVDLAALIKDGDSFPAAIHLAHLLDQDPNLPKDLCEQLKCANLRPTGAGSVGKNFDSHFKGELWHLAKVVGFVLSHNFRGFSLGFHFPAGSPTADETDAETSSS